MRSSRFRLRHSIESGIGRIANTPHMGNWVERAHGIGDDLSTDESAMLVELAAVVYDWPVRNPVAERALHKAAMTLLGLACHEEGHRVSYLASKAGGIAAAVIDPNPHP